MRGVCACRRLIRVQIDADHPRLEGIDMPRLVIPAICLSLMLSGVSRRLRRGPAVATPIVRDRISNHRQSMWCRRAVASRAVTTSRAANTISRRRRRGTAGRRLSQRGSGQYIDDLLRRLENESRLLCLDMADNYSHNTGFKEAYQSATIFGSSPSRLGTIAATRTAQ